MGDNGPSRRDRNANDEPDNALAPGPAEGVAGEPVVEMDPRACIRVCVCVCVCLSLFDVRAWVCNLHRTFQDALWTQSLSIFSWLQIEESPVDVSANATTRVCSLACSVAGPPEAPAQPQPPLQYIGLLSQDLWPSPCPLDACKKCSRPRSLTRTTTPVSVTIPHHARCRPLSRLIPSRPRTQRPSSTEARSRPYV